jgi:hypothetical protein
MERAASAANLRERIMILPLNKTDGDNKLYSDLPYRFFPSPNFVTPSFQFVSETYSDWDGVGKMGAWSYMRATMRLCR